MILSVGWLETLDLQNTTRSTATLVTNLKTPTGFYISTQDNTSCNRSTTVYINQTGLPRIVSPHAHVYFK